MTDGSHDTHRLDSAHEQADEVRGDDQAGHCGGEVLDLRAQPDQGPEQPVREQQQSERREQRRDGGEGLADAHLVGLNARRLRVASMVFHRCSGGEPSQPNLARFQSSAGLASSAPYRRTRSAILVVCTAGPGKP